MRTLALALILTVSLAGCGAWSYTKSLFVTGVSLEALGDQFVQITEQVRVGCDESKAIPPATCEKYRAFGLNFKRVYPLTVGMWTAAQKAGDTATKEKAEAVARSLAADLTKLAAEALGAFAQEGK